jgi:hypothetical protein
MIKSLFAAFSRPHTQNVSIFADSSRTTLAELKGRYVIVANRQLETSSASPDHLVRTATASSEWVSAFRNNIPLQSKELALSFNVFCLIMEWIENGNERQRQTYWSQSDGLSKLGNKAFFSAIMDSPNTVSELRQEFPNFEPEKEYLLSQGAVRESERTFWNTSLTRSVLLGTKALAGATAVQLGAVNPLPNEDNSFGAFGRLCSHMDLLSSCSRWLSSYFSPSAVRYFVSIQMPNPIE